MEESQEISPFPGDGRRLQEAGKIVKLFQSFQKNRDSK